MTEAEALEFYRERVLAAHNCAQRWLFNAENLGNLSHISRRNVLRQCATELLDALGAVKKEGS
jgi:hypothetical protein